MHNTFQWTTRLSEEKKYTHFLPALQRALHATNRQVLASQEKSRYFRWSPQALRHVTLGAVRQSRLLLLGEQDKLIPILKYGTSVIICIVIVKCTGGKSSTSFRYIRLWWDSTCRGEGGRELKLLWWVNTNLTNFSPIFVPSTHDTPGAHKVAHLFDQLKRRGN